MSKWISNQLKKLKRFYQTNPIQLVFLSCMLVLIGSQAFSVYSTYRQQNVQRERIEQMETISLSGVQALAREQNIKEIVSHQIKAGTWLYPEQRSYLEIVSTDGISYAWESSTTTLLGEEFNKMLFEASLESPIIYKTGAVLVDNSLNGFITTSILFLGIMVIMVAGQKLMTEIIGGHSFAAQKPNQDLLFDDVIGYEEVKKQLRETLEHLRHAEKHAKDGIMAPKGILFTGNPGVGKTLLASAMANELGADFFTCTGADFAEMYTGVGPKRVRSLFKLARLSALSIIFIDEIDALGSRETMGQDSERRATLNAMLAEMDGINRNGRLLVIGATNYPDQLDAALKRAGRFDTTIHIPLPDAPTREAMLKHYLADARLDPKIDTQGLSMRMNGYSGAQIKNVVMEAKRLALREHLEKQNEHDQKNWVITEDIIQRAQEIMMLGVQEHDLGPEDLERVAYHELGHALANYLYCPDAYVEKITIKGRGQALGYALSRPLKDQKLITTQQMKGRLVMLMAGRAAEKVILGDVSGGAADDLKKANQLARTMVLEYAMGRGFEHDQAGDMNLLYQAPLPPPNHPLPHELEHASYIRDLLVEAHERAEKMVSEYRVWFDDKHKELLEHGTLHHHALFDHVLIQAPPVKDFLSK